MRDWYNLADLVALVVFFVGPRDLGNQYGRAQQRNHHQSKRNAPPYA